MTNLTAADRKLFRGTAAEVHDFMSNEEILASIGCNFNVIRQPAESGGRTYNDCQLWLRDDTQDMLGFFGTKRQIIQPGTFVDYFRSFCASASKQINFDVIGSYNNGRTLYMGAKLSGNNAALLEGGGGLYISRPGHSAYIPSEDRTDHWLILTESFGESLRPRVTVLSSELVCTNGLAKRVTECEVKLSHYSAMSADVVHAVLDHAIRQCRAYDRIKERLIETPISMDTARAALREFFGDEDGKTSTVKRLEQIYRSDLIGGELDTRTGNAWRLASAVTEYTSHSRIRNEETAFRSQLEGSRARTANGFMQFLEEQFLDRSELIAV
ncbi:MAG: DUF932 domain-containing protein [Chthoniobacterales bacterium]|jgi:hypothetical protein